MNEPLITVVGNVGAPPRTRVVGSGAVVTDFRIASTPRKVDKASGAWSDGVTMWFTVSCWRMLAENVAASLRTGDRVVVTGQLRAQTWQTEQGEERSGLEIAASSVGFDLGRGRAVQERSVPMTLTSDPGQRPVQVDLATGEVLAGGGGPEEDDVEEPDDDRTSLGEPVAAVA